MRTEPNLRTEQHLRTALAAREDLVPDPDPVLAGARAAATRHRRRRATATAVAAAGVMVAGVLTVPAILAASGSPAPAPAPPPAGAAPSELPAAEPYEPTEPRPPYAFTIAPSPLLGVEIQPFAVTPDYQVARILRDGEDVATLTIYDPGVNVRTGGSPSLEWEYVPDGRAEIADEGEGHLDPETMQALADSLEFTAPYQVRLPYRLGYLPAGVTPFNVAQDTAEPGAYRSTIQLETDDLIFDISIVEDPADAGYDGSNWDWRATTVAGHPAECADVVDGRRCRVELDELTVDIGSGSLTPAELDRIVAGLQPATWEDPATWYELDAALPGE